MDTGGGTSPASTPTGRRGFGAGRPGPGRRRRPMSPMESSRVFAEIGRALALIVHRDVEVWAITGVSLMVSTSAVVAAVALGLPLTYALARSGPRVTRVGMWFAHSAAALPTVVVGLTLYFVLSASGPLGWTRLLYTRTAMAMGQLVLALPLLVAVVPGALHRLPESASVLPANGP